jgi:hypothetical protein
MNKYEFCQVHMYIDSEKKYMLMQGTFTYYLNESGKHVGLHNQIGLNPWTPHLSQIQYDDGLLWHGSIMYVPTKVYIER